MVSSTVFHVARNEMSSAAVTLMLLLMAAFVAFMRWLVMPIRARRAT
jgi:hypothetical protein